MTKGRLDPNRPTVLDVLPKIRALYSGEAECSRGTGIVGGHLHIVLDDDNVEDGHVRFCIDAARNDGCATCVEIGELLIRMSITRREKLNSSR